MLAFVKALWHDSIVATATGEKSQPGTLEGHGLALAPIQ
jgi:hypothetical protein